VTTEEALFLLQEERKHRGEYCDEEEAQRDYCRNIFEAVFFPQLI